jgi:DNA-binding IclR family transcriptional regulator
MTQHDKIQAAMECRETLDDGPWMVLLYMAAHQLETLTIGQLSDGVGLPEPVALDHLRTLVNKGHVTFTAGLPLLHFGGDAVFHGLMHRLTRTRTMEAHHGL